MCKLNGNFLYFFKINIWGSAEVGESGRTGFERCFYMSEINRKLIGRTGLSMAINYFTLQGYTVCLPINDTQWYDLVIEKDGKLQTVQCKATQTANDEISLRNMGGTNGGVYDNLINHSELDYLFCVNKDLNMWCIPMSDLLAAGNKNKITLRINPTTNNQGFQTYKYRVQFSDKA
jgi:hypothetical protein